MSHDLLVYLAKTVGLIWMMGFFLIVIVWAYHPRRRAGYERVARSILAEGEPEERP